MFSFPTSRKVSAYKSFIDSFVDVAQSNVTVDRIRKNGHAERWDVDDDFPLDDDEIARKDFLLSLKPIQRELLASMLEDERASALHDALARLDEACSLDQTSITWNGTKLTKSPYASMHFDFNCRHEGDAWPDEQED